MGNSANHTYGPRIGPLRARAGTYNLLAASLENNVILVEDGSLEKMEKSNTIRRV